MTINVQMVFRVMMGIIGLPWPCMATGWDKRRLKPRRPGGRELEEELGG